MTKYLEKKIIYMFLEKFKFILVYLEVLYTILITGYFDYLELCHFFHFFCFFLKNSVF